MKTNEFVKKFGWGWAKDVVNNQPKTDAQIFNPYNQKYSSSYNIKKGVSVAWLKRIVESHELVVRCGGLEDARSHLESIRFNIATKTWFGQALLNWSIYADKLEKAIADVESCQ